MKKFINNLIVLFSVIINNKILKKPDFSEKKLFLQGKLNEENILKKNKIVNFKDVEFSVFSQFGEDGVISWLIDKIPNIPQVFIEIGTQDYWESNTRFLLKSKKWKGYLIDSSKKDINKIMRQRIYWQHKLKAINEFVDKENINTILKKNINEKEIGLLSIDIDGNDYWVLEQINEISPVIIVCEFNSIFGDQHKVSVPYNKNFIRNKMHYSNIYFGASISAFISLLEKKKYTFVGSCSTGVNAFFVKNDYKYHLNEKIEKINCYPSCVRESLDVNGKLDHTDIFEQIDKIKDLEVIDIDENKKKKLSDYDNLYSKSWLNLFNSY